MRVLALCYALLFCFGINIVGKIFVIVELHEGEFLAEPYGVPSVPKIKTITIRGFGTITTTFGGNKQRLGLVNVVITYACPKVVFFVACTK